MKKFILLAWIVIVSSCSVANAGECSVDGLSIKTALAAKTVQPSSNITIVDVNNTEPSVNVGYVDTVVGYETPDSMAYKTVKLTVKGVCIKS